MTAEPFRRVLEATGYLAEGLPAPGVHLGNKIRLMRRGRTFFLTLAGAVHRLSRCTSNMRNSCQATKWSPSGVERSGTKASRRYCG